MRSVDELKQMLQSNDPEDKSLAAALAGSTGYEGIDLLPFLKAIIAAPESSSRLICSASVSIGHILRKIPSSISSGSNSLSEEIETSISTLIDLMNSDNRENASVSIYSLLLILPLASEKRSSEFKRNLDIVSLRCEEDSAMNRRLLQAYHSIGDAENVVRIRSRLKQSDENLKPWLSPPWEDGEK